MVNYKEVLSSERKLLQEKDLLPKWFTTAGWQLFKERYLWASTPREQYETIASTLASHMPTQDMRDLFKEKFFELLWKGWLSPSTPVLANTGTNRGLPVSCSGGYVHDSVDGFYTARKEAALLTKEGFGTSGYLGDIRPRGAAISAGGKASGILPVLKGFVQDSRDVSQGGVRRGSWAGYIPIDHGDFDEVVNFFEKEPDDVNIGWTISNDWLKAIESGDKEANRRYKRALKAKMVTGKGYFFFPDKANAHLPPYYPISVKASNLCSEIVLPSDEEHTFTCVLSSMNVAKLDEWENTDAIATAITFLDCVVSEFLARASGISGLENAVRFTSKARALGLGVAGFHTYLQSKGWSYGSLDAVYFNAYLFKKLRAEADAQTKRLALILGEAPWSAQARAVDPSLPAVRNCSLLAVAPTKSTALIMGGISEGINPDPAMVYTQTTAGGEVYRVNPNLLSIMKERGVYNKTELASIADTFGSVQHVSWLTEQEKLVFRTAFEIDQHVVVRLAAARTNWLDQWQSLNLFFSGADSPEYVAAVHKEAFKNPDILGLYYVYSLAGVGASVDKADCEACS